MKNSIPTWITILSSLITLLGLFVGGSLYVSPGTFMPEIDFSMKGVSYLTHMWAARQVAIAAIIGYSLIRQSASMLKISLAAYGLMNMQDIFIGVSQHNNGLIIGASVAFLLSGLMILVLNRKEKIE